MISTVTTSTVAVVTTVAVASSLALVSILTLLLVLIQRVRLNSASDLDNGWQDVSTVSSVDNRLAHRFTKFTVLSRALIIGILPLFMAFILIVAMKIMDILK